MLAGLESARFNHTHVIIRHHCMRCCTDSSELQDTILDSRGHGRLGLIHIIYLLEVYNEIKLEKYLISEGTRGEVPPPIPSCPKEKVKS